MTSITNKNLLHRFWENDRGFKFLIESPFYAGNIQTGVIFIPFKGKKQELPDFKQYLVFVGWGKEISLPFKLLLFGGIKFGYFIMNFNADYLSKYQRNESEFSAGVSLSLSYPVLKNLFISVAPDLTVLFTSEKLKFYYVSAGLAYKFNSPDWLRSFFN
ncbi:MAG: hypothetical protein R6W90_14180 [Ignavibacteriaceae bacterium]